MSRMAFSSITIELDSFYNAYLRWKGAFREENVVGKVLHYRCSNPDTMSHLVIVLLESFP